jgi:hypothetical protein
MDAGVDSGIDSTVSTFCAGAIETSFLDCGDYSTAVRTPHGSECWYVRFDLQTFQRRPN